MAAGRAARFWSSPDQLVVREITRLRRNGPLVEAALSDLRFPLGPVSSWLEWMNVIGTAHKALESPVDAVAADRHRGDGPHFCRSRRAALVAGDDPRAGVPTRGTGDSACRAARLRGDAHSGDRGNGRAGRDGDPARRRGAARPLLARMLLLCASGLLAIIAAEAVAAVWRARTHRHPALPVLSTRSSSADADKLNIAVIGGSAAYGLPFEKWLSTGHIVAWKLGEAIPGRRVRLDVLAEPGVHLERMHQKLAEYRWRIDLLIIFSGHNEFTYRYAWSRSPEYYTDEIPFRPGRLLKKLAVRFSPLCGMIQEGIEANGLGDPPPPEITRQLVDVPVCTPDEYAERKEDFRRRLEAIVAHCERTGTLAVLLIPPSNDSGFEPNRSTLPATTPRAEREAFTSRFLTVRAGEQSDPARATESYRAILADQPDFAEAHFRLARLLERSGNRREAEPHYRAARDLDGLLMRCPGDFQEVYREIAARHPQALLIDGQAALAAASPGGILGDELFLDAMHPTVRGHALLAQAVLEGLRQRRAFGWPEGTPSRKRQSSRLRDSFSTGFRDLESCLRLGGNVLRADRSYPV